jgi:predicted ester cyclase
VNQPDGSNNQDRCVEQLICRIDDGAMTALITIIDVDLEQQDSNSTAVSEKAISDDAIKHTAEALTNIYTAYIRSINEQTMHETFSKFFYPIVHHNSHTYSIDDYREMIESSFQDICGLQFTIEHLVVDVEAQHIAACLGFTGTPVNSFRGILPSGGPVQFSEHAFYKIRAGKIEQVWSLLDLASYKHCMGAYE